jgi:hypothetical protein
VRSVGPQVFLSTIRSDARRIVGRRTGGREKRGEKERKIVGMNEKT